MSIGENIKTMRRKCGFTQEELADYLSVTPQAVSKWENGNGLPDITQIVPLAQVFGITTDALLGVTPAASGNAHILAAEKHVRLLMSTSQPAAEKHLAAYSYLCAESEKEPANYTLMRKCVNHAAEISRYADFEGFLSDKPQVLDGIIADCERKNACISRYCEDKCDVEKSDYAMTWIYIHTRQFDKAKVLIDRLPSLESASLREHIMTQFVHFQFGFEREKKVIAENIRRFMSVTMKEFLYGFEDYAWFADAAESLVMSSRMLGVLEAYKAFDDLLPDVLAWEVRIRKFLPRCYAALGDFDSAANGFIHIAGIFVKIAHSGQFADVDEAKSEAISLINQAIGIAEEKYREQLYHLDGYVKAMEIIDRME